MSRAYLFVISALLITRDYWPGPALRVMVAQTIIAHLTGRRGLGRGRFMDFSLRPSVVARSINRHGLGKATTSLA
jgi:hypothetical protein